MSDLKLSQEEQNELEEQVDRFDKWVESGEGRRALEQAAKKSEEVEAQRAEARKVDPKDLEKHVMKLTRFRGHRESVMQRGA